jgi:hypothetical protein
MGDQMGDYDCLDCEINGHCICDYCKTCCRTIDDKGHCECTKLSSLDKHDFYDIEETV